MFKYSVELLSGHELQLAYHLATGYENFTYYPDFKCWRADNNIGEMRLTAVSIINDAGSQFHNSAYKKTLNDAQMLHDMRSENIGMRWDPDRNFVLYYQAFPEISATHPFFATAFMRVIVKKELGNSLDLETLDRMNVRKLRTLKGSPT